MKKLCYLLCLFGSVSVLAADNPASGWLGTFSRTPLTEKSSFWIEGQMRYSFTNGSTNQFLFRTGLLRQLSQVHGLGYLYGHIQSSRVEHRPTFQHTMTYGQPENYKLSHRIRLEARLMEDLPDAARFRYLIRWEAHKPEGLGIVVWDELFISLNKTDWNGDTHMDRNRLFLGFRKSFLENKRIELGYLNQFVPRDSVDTLEHIAVVYLFL